MRGLPAHNCKLLPDRTLLWDSACGSWPLWWVLWVISGFPPPSSVFSFLLWPLSTPPACPSLCCMLSPWAAWLGMRPRLACLCCSSQALLLQRLDAMGLVPTGILSTGQSIPTRSLLFSEACLVLLERCWRTSLMVNKIFLDFLTKFLSVCFLGSAVPLVERSSSHLPACKIFFLYLIAHNHSPFSFALLNKYGVFGWNVLFEIHLFQISVTRSVLYSMWVFPRHYTVYLVFPQLNSFSSHIFKPYLLCLLAACCCHPAVIRGPILLLLSLPFSDLPVYVHIS